MPEQLLDDPEIRTRIQQVGGERVPERVRADALQLSDLRGRTGHNLMHAAHTQTFATSVQKERSQLP